MSRLLDLVQLVRIGILLVFTVAVTIVMLMCGGSFVLASSLAGRLWSGCRYCGLLFGGLNFGIWISG